jgi:C1A family cysteine protease
MGWLPDYPDFRDYTPIHISVKDHLEKLKSKDTISLPAAVDLREWCSPIEDQGELGSCTANAGVGLLEYYERRSFGKYLDASRLFLYKTTRDLLHLTGDSGAYLRSTLGALVLFGVPPEEYWPYEIERFDEEPSAFCYSFAQNYRTIRYFRFDPPGTGRAELLTQIKTYLSQGMPAIFGFTVYNSYEQAETTGKIPFPLPEENVVGGHAVMAVGYDNKMIIRNNSRKGAQNTGAFLIRNSWGEKWGNEGYGWLPYEYVLKGLAEDWWTLLKSEWVDTGQFGENG